MPCHPTRSSRLPENGKQRFSELLMAYIAGPLFMLLPGTFLGVWNVISISNQKAAQAISPTWFGWIGSFILGLASNPSRSSGCRSH